MKLNLRVFIFIIVLLIGSIFPEVHLKASNLQEDTAAVEVRKFPDQAIQAFKNNSDFRYDRPVPDSMGWWDRLLYEIRNWLAGLTGNVNLNWLFKLIIYVVCPLILLYVILRLFNVPVFTLFYKPAEGKIQAHEQGEQDIHGVDFETSIKEAIAKQNYRSAVRYTYLKVLKNMADEQIIHWYPGKTNHEYLAEINAQGLREQFRKLIYYYEYVWYGDFPVDKTTLEEVNHLKDKMGNFLPAGL